MSSAISCPLGPDKSLGCRAKIGEVPDARKMPRGLVKTAISCDEVAIEILGEGEEARVVKSQPELAAEAGRPSEKVRPGIGDDHREPRNLIYGSSEGVGIEPCLRQKDVSDFIKEQGRHGHFEGSPLYPVEKASRFGDKVFILPLDPFDQDRGVNDDF